MNRGSTVTWFTDDNIRLKRKEIPMEKQTNELWKDRKHFLWFPFSFTKYRVANNRLYCQHGFFRQQEHECLLYRILDISLTRSFGNRICGTGTITLRTTDSSDPLLLLKNIKNSRAVKEMLSDLIEEARTQKGITGREILANNYVADTDGDGDVDIDDYL